MRGTVQLLASLAFLACLGPACASPVDVTWDARVDFSRYRTWDWLPELSRSLDAEAPDLDPRALGPTLTRHVARELAAKGLSRDRLGADLLVGARLRVERRLVVTQQSGAVQHLASMHDSPSYDVQATRTQLDPYEKGRLEIAVASSREGRVVWRGVVEDEVRGEIAAHVGELVARLLARFPAADGEARGPHAVAARD